MNEIGGLMGTVRLTPELEEFVKGKSLVNESVDSTLRRLLGYEPGDESRVYVKRDSLMPRAILMAFILDAFFELPAFDLAKTFAYTDYPLASPKILRDAVERHMTLFVNPEQWPRDFELNARNKQPRWKNRFSGMLQEMTKNNVLSRFRITEKDTTQFGVMERYNYKGGDYMIDSWCLFDFQKQMILTHGHPFNAANVWATISEYQLEEQIVSPNPEENDVEFEANIRLFWSVSRLLTRYDYIDEDGLPDKLNTAHFNERNGANNVYRERANFLGGTLETKVKNYYKLVAEYIDKLINEERAERNGNYVSSWEQVFKEAGLRSPYEVEARRKEKELARLADEERARMRRETANEQRKKRREAINRNRIR